MDIEMQFVGYLYTTDLINAPKMEHIKITNQYFSYNALRAYSMAVTSVASGMSEKSTEQ